jgi:hypothetical protein
MQSNLNRALPAQRIPIALSFFCIAATVILSAGCSALPMVSSAGSIADEAAASAGQYQVRMETFGGAKTYQGTIDGPITIQTALERSGAIKKYRNMNVELFRKVEGAYQPLKMPAIYDAGNKMVRPETDYGLLAGDSILVTTQSKNPLGKLMGTLGQ